MPLAPLLASPLQQRPWRAWLGWAVVVLTAHALVLTGLPQLSLRMGSEDEASQPTGFVTRTIAPEAPAPSAPARTAPSPEQAVPPRPAPAPRNEPASAAPAPTPATQLANPGTDGSAAPPPAPAESATPGGAQASSTGATPTPAPAPAAPPAPAPAAPPTPQARPATTARFPASIRMQYEGRGQEKGYINYYGSAELLWQQDGKQYEGKLEISAFGIRMRTWTSRGNLDAASGLQPLRFGDRPRGPEVAVHFQRDKGIISYSNNHPDIPLQPGAQDKLSVLLQLGALGAGAPDLLKPGMHLQFQATDANRAEVWDFAVGPAEKLDLPGGSLMSIRLVKEATVDFDQKIEVWLAPELEYLPVRLRITEGNGSYSDLMWRKSQKTDL